jgi:hypothetical protein
VWNFHTTLEGVRGRRGGIELWGIFFLIVIPMCYLSFRLPSELRARRLSGNVLGFFFLGMKAQRRGMKRILGEQEECAVSLAQAVRLALCCG